MKVASKSIFHGESYDACRALQDHHTRVSVTLRDITVRAVGAALASSDARQKYASCLFDFLKPKATNAGRLVSGKARKASGPFVDLLRDIRAEEDESGNLRYPIPEFDAHPMGGTVVQNFENEVIQQFKTNWLTMADRHFLSRMRQVFILFLRRRGFLSEFKDDQLEVNWTRRSVCIHLRQRVFAGSTKSPKTP